MTQQIKRKKAIIVGASASMAIEFLNLLAKDGFSFLLIGKDEEELNYLKKDLEIKFNSTCEILILDLLRLNKNNITEIVHNHPHASLLAVFSGFMGDEALESLDAVTKINFSVPAMFSGVFAEEKSNKDGGDIVIISSVAGERGKKGNYIYGAAKSALTTFASGLRAKYNKKVNILTILPGFIDTPMTYGNISGLLLANREATGKAIYKAFKKKKSFIYVPFFWRYIMLIIKSIPENIFKKLNL